MRPKPPAPTSAPATGVRRVGLVVSMLLVSLGLGTAGAVETGAGTGGTPPPTAGARGAGAELAAILAQRLDLRLQRVRLSEALVELAERSGLRCVYPVPLDDAPPWSLVAEQISVAEILERLAAAQGLQLEFSEHQVVLWRRVDARTLADLERKLASGGVQAACEAVHDLACLGDPGVHPLLLRALTDPRLPVSATALAALDARRDLVFLATEPGPWVEPLLALLAQPVRSVQRGRIARLLGATRDGRVIDALIPLLLDPAVRRDTAFALAATRDPRAVDALLGLLARPIGDAATDDAPARLDAVHALGHARDPRIVEALTPLATTPTDFAAAAAVRGGAVHALGLCRDQRAGGTLITLMGDQHEAICTAAALGLVDLLDADERAIPSLVSNLQNWYPAMRSIAADVLVRSGAAAEARLLAGLAAADGNVRLGAASVLARMRHPRALEALIALMTHPDEALRAGAAHALGRAQDPDGIPALAQLARSAGMRSRIAAITALGRIRTTESVAALVAMAGEPHALVRGEVARALGESRDDRAAAALVTLMEDPDASVRVCAVAAARWPRHLSTTAPLLARLRDADPRVRTSAVLALGDLRDPQTIDPLLACLDDGDARVSATVGAMLRVTADPRIIARLLAVARTATPNTSRHADPALQHLFDTLLGYREIAAPPRRQVASSIALDSPQGRLLAAAGVAVTTADDVLAALRSKTSGIVVVDATAERLASLAGDLEAVQRFTASGGWLVAWGVAPDGLAAFNRIVGVGHLIRPFRRERVDFTGVRDPLVAGLARSDLAMPATPEDALFTHVLDLDDIAPFCAYPPWQRFNPGAAEPAPDRDPLRLVDGLTTRDDWRHVFQLSTDPPFLAWDVELPRPEAITGIELINNGLYRFLSRIEVTVDGDAARTVPLVLSPATEVVQAFPLAFEGVSRLGVRLAAWTDGETGPTVGIDEWRIRVRRSPAFHERVRPLLTIGAMIRYPQGEGGVLLCNLRVPEQPSAGDTGRRRLLGTVLRNLGADVR